MLKLVGKGENLENNKKLLLENIENNKAYHKFIKLVENQGGDSSFIENLEKLPKAKYIEPIYSQKTGYVQEMDSKEIGKLAGILGAGREKKEDNIDHAVGIILTKKVSDKIENGEILAYIHANDETKLKEAKTKLQEIIKISKQDINKEKTILEIVK